MPSLALRVSEAADRATAHPLALPAYIGVSVVMHAVLSTESVTLVLSHFANLVLLLLAASSRRRDIKMECEIDAMAEAMPDVDHEAARRESDA